MFVHSGASLHGHEYSERPAGHAASPTMQPRRSPFLRSALAPPMSRLATSPAPRVSPTPHQRKRSVSDCVLRTPETVVRFLGVDGQFDNTVATPQGSILEEDNSESDVSDVATQSTASQRRTTRRRKVPRKSTKYVLGYPAPKKLSSSKVMQKVLPRLLLQLQLLENGWPKPIMEVFPASRISGPMVAPRLAKRFPGIVSARRQLGRDDLVLIGRDDQNPSQNLFDSEDEEEKDTLEDNRLLAVYSPLKHSDTAEIVLEDGSIWVAKPLPSGSYDFVHANQQGETTTVRWAKRSASAAATATSTPMSEIPVPADSKPQKRFTFSIINPQTRRHPVLATLTETGLDVQDTYCSVSPSGRHMSMSSKAKRLSASSMPERTGKDDDDEMAASSDSKPKKATLNVDEATKSLISVTAMWVVLQTGWSSCYTPASAHPMSPASPKLSMRNSWSGRSESPALGTSSPDNPSLTHLPKRFSAPVPARARSPSPVSGLETAMSSPVAPAPGLGPRRATSTGAAYMQRRMEQTDSIGRGYGSVREAPTDKADGSFRHKNKGNTRGPLSLVLPHDNEARGNASQIIPRPQPQPQPQPQPNKVESVKKRQHGDARNGEQPVGKRKGLRGKIYQWIHKFR